MPNPEPSPASAAGGGGDGDGRGASPATAPSVAPKPPPSSNPVRTLSRARAAYFLSRRAMRLLCASLAALLLILILTEFWHQYSLGNARAAAVASSSPGIERLARELERARGGAVLTASEIAPLRLELDRLAAEPGAPARRVQALATCLTSAEAPEAPGRSIALNSCVALVEALPRGEVRDAAALVQALEASRAAFRATWLSAAQLILVNLLLPLLTGLFGYLFGRNKD